MLAKYSAALTALHNFAYDDAARLFRDVQRLAPASAIGYWGEALSFDHPIWQEEDLPAARATLARLGPSREARASRIADGKTRSLLGAVEALFAGGSWDERHRSYRDEMAAVARAYPNDVEVQSLFALSILGAAGGGATSERERMRAAAILEGILRKNSNHPGALHYLIHAYDDPTHAPLGLWAARRYAGVAPGAHHALHMPAHIFVQLGLWQDAIAANAAAFRQSDVWRRALNFSITRRDYHSLSWLQYALLQEGHFAEARAWADTVERLALETSSDYLRDLTAIMWARYAVESGDYSHLPELRGASAGLDRDDLPVAYARAVVALRSGDTRALGTIIARVRASWDVPDGNESLDCAIVLRQIEALSAMARGDTTVALIAADSASLLEDRLPTPSGPPFPIKPARELFGELLLAAGKNLEAVTQFDRSLLRTPHRTAGQKGRARAAHPAGFALVHVNVLPMDREIVLRDQTVVVSAGRISALGPANEVPVPPRMPRIERPDAYLIPGLIDMHVHVDDANDFPLYLAKGVTAVRNMRGAPHHVAWRSAINRGDVVGPSLFTTGPFVSGLTTEAEADSVVRRHQAAGYQWIKLHGDMGEAAYDRLVVEARRVGVPVVGHVPRNLSFDVVLRDRPLSIDHAEEYLYTVFTNREDSLATGIAVKTKLAGIAVTPTLVAFRHLIDQVARDDHLLNQPGMHYIPPYTRRLWRPENNPYARRLPGTNVPRLESELALLQGLVRELDRADVPLLLGTDAMTPSILPGYSAHEELRELVAAGVPEFRALQTATRNAAAVLGADSLGTIAVGKRADMVLLEGNPLERIQTTQEIIGVVLRGRWMPARSLTERLDSLARGYVLDERRVATLARQNLRSVFREVAHDSSFWTEPRLRLLMYRVAERVARLVDNGRLDSAYSLVEGARVASAASTVPSLEAGLNRMGYHRMQENRLRAATAIFALNARLYPASSNVWDSLGEAQLARADTASAVRSYRKSLDLDPRNDNARQVLERIAVQQGKP